jgi:predicted MFS family arabinose efflux permease
MKFSRLVLPGVAMIAVTYGLARFSFGLLLPGISESLAMSEFVSGIMSSLFYLSYCFTVLFSTVTTTREGPRRMILYAGLSAFIGMLLIGGTPNTFILAAGVLFAGASTGFVSPPYGAAVSLWIEEDQQGKANTWINSGTSLGIVLSGAGAVLLTDNWRITYLIYAFFTLLVLIWNARIIPKNWKKADITFEKGNLSVQGMKGAAPLVWSSLVIGISSAAFWTFSRSFIEITGSYNDWQLSVFWITIGVFGVFGGFSGTVIAKKGLPFAYRSGSLFLAFASILLSIYPENLGNAYLSAGIFGSAYIFITGVLLVWGIQVFIDNASLGIAVPFLVLAIGQIIGSLLAGFLIGHLGYRITFMLYGIVGMLAVFLPPGKIKTNK